MIKIETNTYVRQKIIDAEVKQVIKICKETAKQGRQYCNITMDRDIQRDVRDVLEKTTNIFVAINYGASPSRACVEYFQDEVIIKFTWT